MTKLNDGKRYNLLFVSFATYIPVGAIRKWCVENKKGNKLSIADIYQLERDVHAVPGAMDAVVNIRTGLKNMDIEKQISGGVWRKEFGDI